MTPTRTRLRIDRLELDLRGIAPATASAMAHALGPALAQALAVQAGAAPPSPAGQLDAGRVTAPASTDAGGLAGRIAARIATTVRGESS